MVRIAARAAPAGATGEPLSGWFESPREPHRLEQQVRGERMRLQPPPATPASAPGA
ncbi:hypothetical protein CT19431_230027 [Cupriavidus taiwanensis]|nr:hypothetical protein CT19431_230027 [Cupriavidus taiwanensis]